MKAAEDERKRQEQIAAAAKAQAEALHAKKLAAEEKKRKAEEQILFAGNWKDLINHFENDDRDVLVNVKQLISDAKSWRNSIADSEEQKNKKIKAEE